MWKVYNVLRLVLFLPWTLYFNFRYFPFRQARKLPVWFYLRPSFIALGGVILLDTERITSGMIKFGYRLSQALPRRSFRWNCQGKVVLGSGVSIADHAYICVERNGELTIGHNTIFNSGVQIFCNSRTTIGKDCAFGWDVTISDTDYHCIVDMVSGKTMKSSAPITLADHCWLGNNCSVAKGTKLPQGSIVSAHSVVKGKFKKENAIYAGNPIALVDDGYDWKL